MDNNNFDTMELQEMKEQIALLKSKLEKETIVSDTMMRRILSDKARPLKTMGLGKTLACFLAVPMMLWCNWFFHGRCRLTQNILFQENDCSH